MTPIILYDKWKGMMVIGSWINNCRSTWILKQKYYLFWKNHTISITFQNLKYTKYKSNSQYWFYSLKLSRVVTLHFKKVHYEKVITKKVDKQQTQNYFQQMRNYCFATVRSCFTIKHAFTFSNHDHIYTYWIYCTILYYIKGFLMSVPLF